MSEGPSRQEIERAREALERHDSELRDEDDAPPPRPEPVTEDEDDEG
jgi:hypothetical protein